MTHEKNIVILGGGFAGLSALDRLTAFPAKALPGRYRVVLVDRKRYSEFLPMLPDIVSGRVHPDALKTDLAERCSRRGALFLEGEAVTVDTGGRKIKVNGEALPYEYLVLSAGAENEFFGMEKLKRLCHKVYSCDDSLKLRREISERASSGNLNVVVAGGGYTGIEIATNVRVLSEKLNKTVGIILLEKAGDILMMTPEWMRISARKGLESMAIEVRCGESLADVSDGEAVLGSGEKIPNAVCIWAAGVRSADILGEVGTQRIRTRIKVDSFLRPVGEGDHEGVFIAGDSAAFPGRGTDEPIRMAVIFALGQGGTAADNILRSIRGLPLLKYRYNDPGYLIPLACGRAPGIIMGMRVNGLFGFIMHYFMCLYRSTFRNKIAVLKSWLGGL